MSEANFSKTSLPQKTVRKCNRSSKQSQKSTKTNLSLLVENKIKELETKSAAAEAIIEKRGISGNSKVLIDPLVILKECYLTRGSNGLSELMQMYSQTLRTTEKELLQARRMFDADIKEKDHISSECTRTSQVKTRLETLCRDLQKQNKLLSEDAKLRASEHSSKREEVSEKLRESIQDITSKVEKQAEENAKMDADNDILASKLEELKENFRKKIEAHQEQLNEKANVVKKLLEEVPQLQVKTEKMAMAVATHQNNIAQYKLTAVKLKEHIDLIKSRMTEFEDARTKTKEYSESANSQKLKLSSTVDDTQRQRDDHLSKKNEFTKIKEVVFHDIKELKKKIASSEKLRKMLELECRKLSAEKGN